MKKLVWLAGLAVFTTVGAGGYAVYRQVVAASLGAPGSPSASLDDEGFGGGAALDSGPVPVVPADYELSAHQTLSRVIILIKENYVDPERIKPYEMFMAALDYIQKTVAEVTVDDAEAPKRVRVTVGKNEQIFDLERLGGLDQLWEVTLALRDIFRFLQTHISDPEQRRDIEYAAINGMLGTLDPHSVLLKPESFDEVKMSTKGEFGGLGIVISIRDGALTVISPIEDTPAARAGIKAQDQIVKIGEESTVNMGLEDAVERLRGKPGSKVNVWIKRKKWSEAKKFTLTRAIIKIQSVASELLEGGVGYVRIKSFQQNTYDDLHTHLDKLKKRNKGELAGLVLDLRNNPGGLLDQAILISDRFIDRGPLVITVGEGNRKREVKSAHLSGTEPDYPMVVLVNGGSASASEIVAGALKNHDRAAVIGQQTFGKGSVQVLYDFKDKSALKLTIAQYLTPGDVSIQSVGIAPDVEIAPATIEGKEIHVFVDDDSLREKDLQHHLDVPTALRGGVSRGSGGKDGAGRPVRLVHLLAASPEATQQKEESEAAERFVADFEIELARDMIARAKTHERQALLEGAMPLFTERSRQQDAAISKKLADLGVDWAVGDASQQEGGEVAVELSIKSPVTGKVVAGDKVTLSVTAKNTGAEALARVYGISKSDNPLFKNLEFVFGKLAPGASRTWDAEVTVPKDFAERADEVKVELGDARGPLKSQASRLVVTIAEQPKPRFAFVAWIDDREGGNGDGVLQGGEKVRFKVDVKNVGEAAAEEAVVSLKNMSADAIFLDRGREKIGSLKPGKGKVTDLEFSVRATEPQDVELKVAVWDSALGEAVQEIFRVPVVADRKPRADAQVVRVAGTSDVVVRAGAGETMPVVARAKPGALMRSDVVFDAWRRVELKTGQMGFVQDVDVKPAPGKKPGATGLRPVDGTVAPTITLALPSLVVATPSLQLSGVVADETGLKDVFVFVNDRKVHYEAYGSRDGAVTGSANAASAGSTPAPVKAAIEVSVPLKPGSNTITLVARENDELVARKVVGIFRASPDAVAERVPAELRRDAVAQ